VIELAKVKFNNNTSSTFCQIECLVQYQRCLEQIVLLYVLFLSILGER